MNDQDNRQKLVNFRTIAEALRRDHMSHERRREQMKMLWNMINDETEKVLESEYHNCLMALLEILRYATLTETLTHTGVKVTLRLFEVTCTSMIVQMYVPDGANSDAIPF